MTTPAPRWRRLASKIAPRRYRVERRRRDVTTAVDGGFLWLSVLGGGIGLGAKLFDLMVVAGAWGAAPPASLALMPYGPRYPMDPGGFFQPLSALMLVGILGALISGWRTSLEYRMWLWVPVIAFLIIWICTPTVFWPMIRELYGAGSRSIKRSDAELILLVRRWMIWDWFRVALIAAGFLSSVRAISLPLPRSDSPAASSTATVTT